MLWLVRVEGDLTAIFPTEGMALESIAASFRHMERVHTYDPNEGEDVSIWFRNGDDLLKVRIETMELSEKPHHYLLIGFDPSED